MGDLPHFEVVPFRELPPGATRVYCAYPKGHPPGDVFHTDPDCPKLASAWRLAAVALVDVVNWAVGATTPCTYCVADVETLRVVARDHDEYGRPVAIQAGLEVVL